MICINTPHGGHYTQHRSVIQLAFRAYVNTYVVENVAYSCTNVDVLHIRFSAVHKRYLFSGWRRGDYIGEVKIQYRYE